MITLLHGENLVASRARFQALQDVSGGTVISIDLSTSTSPDPLATLQTTGLFSEKQFAAIENAISTRSVEKLIPYNLSDSDAVFWEGKQLTAAQITAFQKVYPGATVLEFKIDPVVFKFLDSLCPGNNQEMVDLFQKYQKTDPPELIFTMLVRQFRLLILSSTNEKTGPDEWLRLSWQKPKLASQANAFPRELLLQKYRQLSDIDYRSKTGQLPEGSLASALELFLLTL